MNKSFVLLLSYFFFSTALSGQISLKKSPIYLDLRFDTEDNNYPQFYINEILENDHIIGVVNQKRAANIKRLTPSQVTINLDNFIGVRVFDKKKAFWQSWVGGLTIGISSFLIFDQIIESDNFGNPAPVLIGAIGFTTGFIIGRRRGSKFYELPLQKSQAIQYMRDAHPYIE
jgi:hypothetical protein